MAAKPELPIIPFASPEAWEAWLDGRHAVSDGLWMKIAKKGSGIATVTFSEALDVALCYGWIDSQSNKFDEDYYLQRFTPRRSRSKWSQVNRDKVARLIDEGRMKPAGMREVERAKADGRWDAAYEPPSKATVPDDLRVALEKDDEAREFFETLDRTNRYVSCTGSRTPGRPRRGRGASRSTWRCSQSGRSSIPEGEIPARSR